MGDSPSSSCHSPPANLLACYDEGMTNWLAGWLASRLEHGCVGTECRKEGPSAVRAGWPCPIMLSLCIFFLLFVQLPSRTHVSLLVQSKWLLLCARTHSAPRALRSGSLCACASLLSPSFFLLLLHPVRLSSSPVLPFFLEGRSSPQKLQNQQSQLHPLPTLPPSLYLHQVTQNILVSVRTRFRSHLPRDLPPLLRHTAVAPLVEFSSWLWSGSASTWLKERGGHDSFVWFSIPLQ